MLPGVPERDISRFGDDTSALDAILQAEREQHARAVRADMQARSHLGELGGPLEDLDLEAPAEKRKCGGQAADARTDNQYLRLARHQLKARTKPASMAFNTDACSRNGR